MNIKKGKTAIVIANWNGLRFLGDCLTAVYAQTYMNFDVYIVDNGSTDGSVAFVREKFSKVNILTLQKNTGFAHANNVGIAEAFCDRGVKYILTLNNDAVMDRECLVQLVETIAQDEKIASVTPKIKYAGTNMIDSVGMVISRDGGAISRGYKEEDRGQYDPSVEIFGASACSALYRREALEDVRYRDEFFDNSFFAYYEDLDLAWRLRLCGWKSWYAPRALVSHIHSGTSVSYSPFKAYHVNRNRFFIITKNLPWNCALSAFIATPIRYLKLLHSLFVVKSGPSYELKKKSNVFVPFLITIQGWGSFILNFPQLITKRHFIQSRKKVSSQKITSWFSKYPAREDDMIYR